MNINRYHKSFIGLMEQCNTGSWCKFNDVFFLSNRLENEIEKLNIEIVRLTQNNSYLIKKEKVNSWTIKRLTGLNIALVILLLIDIFK